MDSVVEYIRHDEHFRALLFKSMDLDMNKLLSQCEEEKEIKLDEDEKDRYKYHINKAKEKILDYSLIK